MTFIEVKYKWTTLYEANIYLYFFQNEYGWENAFGLFGIKGFGHYIHHEEMMTKPLEEMMEDLLANDPDAAARLLESKGLYLMPLSSVQELCWIKHIKDSGYDSLTKLLGHWFVCWINGSFVNILISVHV